MAERTDGVDLTERSTGELFKDLSQQLSTLVREEIALAKAEMTPKAKAAVLGAGMFGAAGVVMLLGAGALVAAAIAGLANVMQVWLAAVIVGGALIAIGALAGLAGKASVGAATPPLPEQTMTTTKEDVEWLKARTRSAKQ